MSQLMKMLNDDTTQILLAIVFGIVICWFIFGGNGGNNGFSVGGPIDIRSLDLACKRALEYLDINFTTSNPEKRANYRIHSMGNPTDPEYWDEEIGNDRCDLANIDTAEDDTCCFGTGTGEQDDVTYLDSGEQARPIRYRPPSTMGALLQRCPEDLQWTIDSYIAACNSNFPLGDEGIAGGLQCDEDSDCTGVAPGHNMPNSRCEITQTTPWPAGTCVEESQEEADCPSGEFRDTDQSCNPCTVCPEGLERSACTPTNDAVCREESTPCVPGESFNESTGEHPCNPCTVCPERGINTPCTTTSDTVCNTAAEIVSQRNQNIARDMKTMLSKLVEHSPVDRTLLTQVDVTQQDSINAIRTMAGRYDLHFIVLENVGDWDTELTQDQVSQNLQQFVTQCSIQPGNIGADVEDTLRPDRPVSTCNLYDSLSNLPPAIQTFLYCQNNTLHLTEGEAYDPLLKVRTTDMDGGGVGETVGCGEVIHIPSDTSVSPEQTLTTYIARLNANSQNTDTGSRLYSQNLFESTPRHNNKMLLVQSRPTTHESANLLTLELEVTGNYTYFSGQDSGSPITVPTGTYTLLFTDGMSENGTPYDELFSEVKTMFDNFRNWGDTSVFNSMGHLHIVQWYLSLYVVQYYILKVLFGTGGTFRDTPGIDFVRTLDVSARGQETQVRDAPLQDPSNPSCRQSGKDYFIMGLVKKNGQNHMEVQYDSQTMDDYTSLAETVGLYIGPGQEGQNYTLAKINQTTHCLPLEENGAEMTDIEYLRLGDCGESKAIDETCLLECDDGYTASNNDYLTLTCEEGGNYSAVHQDLSCNQDTCQPVDGSSLARNLTLGDCGESKAIEETCLLECDDGYTANNPGYLTLTCGQDGEYSGIDSRLTCNEDEPDDDDDEDDPDDESEPPAPSPTTGSGIVELAAAAIVLLILGGGIVVAVGGAGGTAVIEAGVATTAAAPGPAPDTTVTENPLAPPAPGPAAGPPPASRIADPGSRTASQIAGEGRSLTPAPTAAAQAQRVADTRRAMAAATRGGGRIQMQSAASAGIQGLPEGNEVVMALVRPFVVGGQDGFTVGADTITDAVIGFIGMSMCKTINENNSTLDQTNSRLILMENMGVQVQGVQPQYIGFRMYNTIYDLIFSDDTTIETQVRDKFLLRSNMCNGQSLYDQYNNLIDQCDIFCSQNCNTNIQQFIDTCGQSLINVGYKEIIENVQLIINDCIPESSPPAPAQPAPTDNQFVLSDLHDSRKVCDMACQTYGGEFSRFPMCNVPYQLYYIAGHADYDDSPYVDGPISSQEREYYNQHYRGIAREIIQSDRQLSWSRFSDICPATCSNSLSNPNCP